jgi:glucose-6-phosphate isomerase
MQSIADRHSIIPATEWPIWNALERHYQELRKLHLRDLFADDPKRGERLTAEAVGIYLDYSKNRIVDEKRWISSVN